MSPNSAIRSHTEYPKASDLEECLGVLAIGARDSTPRPVLVTLVPVNGGRPPLYAVVLRSRDKENIRQKLSEVLNRQFCLGATSFALKAYEAELVIQYRNRSTAAAAAH